MSGLSEAKGRSMSMTRTALVSSGFTVPWTAPELLQGDAKALASDVFALGVTLWEIFERATPFGHLAEVVVITQLLNGQRPTLTSRTPPKVAHLSTMLPMCCAFTFALLHGGDGTGGRRRGAALRL
jgi:hypothetical protein